MPLGHACGHDQAGVAAGLGLKAALECGGAPKGMVTINSWKHRLRRFIYTGGKIDLIDNGAFENNDSTLSLKLTLGRSIMPGGP